MKKEHGYVKQEIRSISVDRFKTMQGRNVYIHKEHVAFGDKINLRDQCTESPTASYVQ